LGAPGEPVLFNQTHELASGVMTDHLYKDTVSSYPFSKRLAEEIIDQVESSKWCRSIRAASLRNQNIETPV
jgi:hypothetical protein